MKTASKKTISSLAISAFVVCGGPYSAESWTMIAALKGTEVILVDRASGNVTRLTGDPRVKRDLRWLPDGRRISYLVPGEKGDKEFAKFVMPSWPKLVISDLTGQVTSEVSLRPPDNSTNPELIRAIENVEWLSNRFVRFEGSFGPRNCASFELDLDTGKTFSERDGECGSFTASPDGKHVAYRFPVSMGTWDDSIGRVEIDDGTLSYAGVRGAPIHLEAGPVWSEDSQRVAILERRLQSGQIALTTISIRGEVMTVPVPSYTKDDASLTWMGIRVAVGLGGTALVVDPTRSVYMPLDPESSVILERVAHTSQSIRDDQQSMEDVVKKLGGREGVARPNQ
jgi:hypothetical protein